MHYIQCIRINELCWDFGVTGLRSVGSPRTTNTRTREWPPVRTLPHARTSYLGPARCCAAVRSVRTWRCARTKSRSVLDAWSHHFLPGLTEHMRWPQSLVPGRVTYIYTAHCRVSLISHWGMPLIPMNWRVTCIHINTISDDISVWLLKWCI